MMGGLTRGEGEATGAVPEMAGCLTSLPRKPMAGR